MLFFCFSIKDRMPLINDFNQYLSNFGIETWYDRRDIFLGDNRIIQNIENGAKHPAIKYAIIFYSNNFKNGNTCLEEYDILIKRYQKKEIQLFPVFLGDAPDTLEEKFLILKQLVYKEIKSVADFFGLALHIIAKIKNDSLNKRHKSIAYYLRKLNRTTLLFQLLREYENIDKKNYAMRVSFLFSIFKVITFDSASKYINYKTMNFLFYKSCYNKIIEEKRELQVMEMILLDELLRLSPVH